MRSWGALLLASLLLRVNAAAQAPRPAVVVQVAGATLYLNLGSDAGLRVGDTLSVRRRADAPAVGSLTVLGATASRSLLGFVGATFAVTRGDTLYVTPRASGADVVAARATAAPVAASAPTPSRRQPWRSDAMLGAELWGSHTETVGLGADPVRTTRDIAMPAIRFIGSAYSERSQLRLNLRVQQRTGPATLWDRQARLRISEARYDLRLGRAQYSFGRFFSDFDHQSAFWDGAAVRVSATRTLSLGVAAGFEPLRGNEEPSITTPKLAAFVGLRRGDARYDFTSDFALTQTLPSDTALRRSGADLAMRLRVGRFTLSQDLEAAPPSPSAGWELSRFQLRASSLVGLRGQLYLSAVSDRLTPLDTAFVLPFARRERVTAGYSHSTQRGAFVDVNATFNEVRGPTRGYAIGSTVSLPHVLPSSTALLHASWYDDGRGSGVLASPALEYRLRRTRLRGGYQFYHTSYPSFSAQTHGVDFRIWKAFGARSAGVLQVTERLGARQKSTTVYSSFEWRF